MSSARLSARAFPLALEQSLSLCDRDIEQKTGFEPATSTLEGLHSAN